jgi:transcriptional regulator with GAF, ATPase, and Fis domain/tetratricopeptide (TPR) repeat protein
MDNPLHLPEGYECLQSLGEEGEARVLHARGPEGDVVLRLGGDSERSQDLAELAVLAAVDVPGLARLVDFGHLSATGEAWTARTWIEGVELGEWARDQDDESIADLVARLCPALAELHARGFVHADLKPENIIVSPAGEPHILDFGLARRGGEAGAAGGTLFYVAPEVLLGRPAEPASDLFALGVLLHALLIKKRPSAAEFYGKFPGCSFFEASSTSPADLPSWARGVVAQLLERDPSRRHASASSVATHLRTVLGGSLEHQPTPPEQHSLSWSPLAGREAWLDKTLGERLEVTWIELAEGDDCVEWASALRLWLTLRGELASSLEPGQLAAQPEPSSRAVLASAEDSWHLVAVVDEASRRAFAYLVRAVQQARRAGYEGAHLCLLAVAPKGRSSPLEDLTPSAFPPLSVAGYEALLKADFEGDLTALATELEALAGGSLGRAQSVLQAALSSGEFVTGARGFKRRPGAMAELAIEMEGPQVELSRSAARLFSALDICLGAASLEDLRDLTELAESEFAAAVTELCANRAAFWQEKEGAAQLVITRRFKDHANRFISLEEARPMYATRAEKVLGGERALCLFAARGDAATAEGVREEIARVQERGDLPGALDLAERFARTSSDFAPEFHPRAVGELALAWAALGVPERAEALLDDLGDQSGPAALGVTLRVRGRLAHLRHDYTGAEKLLAQAAEIEPDDGGESLFRTALVAFDTHKQDKLASCLLEARRRWPELSGRYRWSLEAIEAMACLRRGEHDEAQERLQRQLDESLSLGDEERQALVRNNLALLERRAGRLDEAAEQLLVAAKIQEERGMLPALAQSHAMLGATRREQGALHEAEALLQSAFEIRERLGDTSGALAARGMLGLALADGGRLRAAADELATSVEVLGRAGRSADAALLGAKLRELRARMEQAPERAFAEEPAPDPRVLLCHARAALLWDNQELGGEYLERAADLAERLGLSALASEIEGLSLLIEGEPRALESALPPGLADRAAVLGHLADPPDRFEGQEALECARKAGFRGRADLAARLAMAVAARSEDGTLRAEATGLARESLEAVERGLTAAEAARARTTLLGLPDPWPLDLEGYEHSTNLDDPIDMDIISLLDINHRLVAQDDLPSLLGEIVESAMAVTRAERGFLVLEEDGELEFDTALHSRRGDLLEPETEVSRSILTRVLETGKTLRLSNATDDPLLGGAPSVAQLELRSILVAPFEVEEGLRGTIYVDHRLREGAFTERSEKLLDLLAGQAALAIRQARRLHQIRELNQKLNRRAVDREADLKTARKALKEAGAQVPSSGLVGSSETMRRVHALIERCAAVDLAVLVCGPSGSGKELAARALHLDSKRSAGPFISESCAALPASLIESELFGCVKGAFTGADRDRAGLFERAHGGTLFLDEIGELPIALQAKLLRVIETGEVRRVGGSKIHRIDFRLLAATNRDLHAESTAGRFRPDLVYRLDSLRVEMPALKAHTEDIPELVEHFLALEAARSESPVRSIAPAVLDTLSRRAWPGNVRELANEVARLCVLSSGDLDDPSLVRPANETQDERLLSFDGAGCTLAELEQKAILAALKRCDGDKRRAAEELGISRAKIYQRLKEWEGLAS